MAYATVEEVEAGFRFLSSQEQAKCSTLLEEAAVLIDAIAYTASAAAKRVVSCRIVRRSLGDGSEASAVPIGATQGSISALGYSQSWTISNGSSGELYLGKTDRILLGVGNKIGTSNPYETGETSS